METLLVNQAGLGIIGWVIVIIAGTYIISLLNKKDKKEEDNDKK